MSKAKKNSQLITIMDEYVSFLESDKQGDMPLIVSNPKQNHPTSLYKEIPIIANVSFGNVVMDCEIRNKDTHNYSIQLTSDKIESRVLARIDEGNGTHRNCISSIPLPEQQVTTPHFHKYNEDGYFFAYQTHDLKDYEEKSLPIEKGMSFFCNEMNVLSTNANPIGILVQEEGTLPFEFNIDPLDGINF